MLRKLYLILSIFLSIKKDYRNANPESCNIILFSKYSYTLLLRDLTPLFSKNKNFGPAYLYNICYMHIFITLNFLFMASEPLLRHRKILKN